MNHAARPWLVLVPGLACDGQTWADLLPALPARCVVAEGRLLDDIGAMAETLLAEAPAERFALAGHSLGGRIALEVMRRAPQRVERLALLDTGWRPRAAGEAGEHERAQREALVALARREGMRAMGMQWAPGMLHPRCLGGPVHEAVLAMVANQSVERFAAQQAALLARPDASEVLASIGCPTLVLCGRQDLWSPLVRHEEMATRIAGARLAVVDDCGHMSPMEQPAAVATALAAWLAAS